MNQKVNPIPSEYNNVTPSLTVKNAAKAIEFYTQALGGVAVMRMLDVAAKALAAGAKELMPMRDEFYGDRTGAYQDPFGRVWFISTHIEDVSDEEMQRRMDALMKDA